MAKALKILVLIFLTLFLFSTLYIRSDINLKDQYILKLLPKNFTLVTKNILTDKARNIHFRFPIEEDEYYITNQENLTWWTNKLKKFKASDGFQLYVKAIEGNGFGVFSNETIPRHSIIGDYLGIITNTVYEDYKYSWNYLPHKSRYYNTPHAYLLLDGAFYGDGWMRYHL
jgi:hypothetical protein